MELHAAKLFPTGKKLSAFNYRHFSKSISFHAKSSGYASPEYPPYSRHLPMGSQAYIEVIFEEKIKFPRIVGVGS